MSYPFSVYFKCMLVSMGGFSVLVAVKHSLAKCLKCGRAEYECHHDYPMVLMKQVVIHYI